MGDGFDTAPTQIIRLEEGIIATTVVLVVAQVQHGGETGIDQQVGRVFLAARVRGARPIVEGGLHRIAGDIPGCGDHGVRSRQGAIESANGMAVPGEDWNQTGYDHKGDEGDGQGDESTRYTTAIEEAGGLARS